MGNQNDIQASRKISHAVLLMLVLPVISSSSQKNVRINSKNNIIGCLPCSRKFLVSAFFEKHASFGESDFEELIDEKHRLADSCASLLHDMSHETRVEHHHYLSGEGSHRHLISSINFGDHPAISDVDAQFCKLVLIERLPNSVFADPYELQRLVLHHAFSDAAVFGDTNLELPSSLSNRSVVEVHKHIWHTTSSDNTSGLEFTIVLPLHARYPSLDHYGYSKVVIEQPELILRCTVKHQNEDCSSLLLRSTATSSDVLTWHVPCGNEKLTRIVSIITFVSAIVSALLIIFYSLRHSVSLGF